MQTQAGSGSNDWVGQKRYTSETGIWAGTLEQQAGLIRQTPAVTLTRKPAAVIRVDIREGSYWSELKATAPRRRSMALLIFTAIISTAT